MEMCYMGVWGAISDDRWNENNAFVTCRQLGFEPSGMWTMQVIIWNFTLFVGTSRI